MPLSTSTPTFDMRPLEVFAGHQDEGGDLLPQIVGMFIEDTDKFLTQATAAISDANLATLHFIAHNLIGSCGAVGAARMRVLALELKAALDAGHLSEADSAVQRLVEEFRLVRGVLEHYVATDPHRDV
jgi:HPt (histidine-containing phosphotransfer) domain-containing protein